MTCKTIYRISFAFLYPVTARNSFPRQNIIRGYKDVVAAPQEVEPPAAEHSEEEYDEEETDQVSDIEEVYEYSNQYEDG